MKRIPRCLSLPIAIAAFIIYVFLLLLLFESNARADQGSVTFTWTVDKEASERQEITELRVYQDSSDNAPFTTDPDAGTITIQTDIDGCSNFWATYANSIHESQRTPAIVVCEPQLPDPLPPTQVVEVPGFQLTIDFKPLPGE